MSSRRPCHRAAWSLANILLPLGVSLHQIPVNCPFTAQYTPLSFDGPMRVDANHAGNKQHVPNSFAHKFRPDAAKAPYVVNDNIISGKSHSWHEGKTNDDDQASEQWSRVMTTEQRSNTADITGKYVNKVQSPG